MSIKHPRRARFGFIVEMITWSLFVIIFSTIAATLINTDHNMHKPVCITVSIVLTIICIVGWIDARRDYCNRTERLHAE